MKFSRLLRFTILICAFMISPYSEASSEFLIGQDGTVNIKGAKVMQSAGTTYFTRLYWGDSYIRLTVKSNSKTKVYRGTGESSSFSEIKDGDFIDLIGEIESGGGMLTIIPSQIKNNSVLKSSNSNFSGVIRELLQNQRSFILEINKDVSITIKLATTTRITKGKRNISFDQLMKGDKVIDARGEYDLKKKELLMNEAKVFVDTNIFKEKVHIGKLVNEKLAGSESSITVLIDGIEYRVLINSETEILNSGRKSTSLNRFIKGDLIRILGSILESDESQIVAKIIRNTSI